MVEVMVLPYLYEGVEFTALTIWSLHKTNNDLIYHRFAAEFSTPLTSMPCDSIKSRV